MARRNSKKNQQEKVKKASNAINASHNFGNDLAEKHRNEKQG